MNKMNKSIVKYTSKIMNNKNACGIKNAEIKDISDQHMNNLLNDLFGDLI